ncbi:MAG: bifunctional demethylmenaquinone methyltransferase/2-methoxy-6-polyprenyl-1,4-benzoquinol methylase UbiE [Alistipes sp.]|nr:bifunctional demethylmenaquinone methyltransferase/2-methoxy-6-polyprenyl-1,4-benzoquinol methylase UbiE [Alistipes sp.]MEE0863659.1 bifunctional demethylmenaquinone methyltransferase/2-methoxy-6-polyprenyl-1,4-benzoquinol methylase UbiE [Alistipes sp.]
MKPYNQDQTKKEQVEQMFDNIAPTYDSLNHILSFNIDRIWRRRVMRIVRQMRPTNIIDVATGTADLAIEMAKRCDGVQILGVDLSEEMLSVARRKIDNGGFADRIRVLKGDAENLDFVESESMDVATVAFGVRNFENLERGIQEIYRTLKPGASLVVLEFSIPRNPLIRWVYAQYSHRLLPRVGALLSKDRKAYDYLPDSVEEFPSPDRFALLLREAGFRSVELRSQSFGIAHIYVAVK